MKFAGRSFVIYLIYSVTKNAGEKPALHLVSLTAHIHSMHTTVLNNGNFVRCAVVSIGVSHNEYTFTLLQICVCVWGGGGD
jgi:hypothetical protein